jgi:hypothetical protein
VDGLRQLAVGLSFFGGAFISIATTILFSGSSRTASAFVGGAVIATVTLVGFGGLDDGYRMYSGAVIRWDYVLHLALFVVSGVAICVLVVLDALRSRNALTATLVLWVFGILVFGTFVNWTVNVRAFVPAAPAVGIALARMLDHKPNGARWRPVCAVVATAFVSILVLIGDTQYANGQRNGARASAEVVADTEGGRWFQGHWGFQFYMEQLGFRHVSFEGVDLGGRDAQTDLTKLGFAPGDVCVVKSDDWMVDLNQDDCERLAELGGAMQWTAHTMESTAGAGFYDARFGELPYFLGLGKTVQYTTYRVLHAEAE